MESHLCSPLTRSAPWWLWAIAASVCTGCGRLSPGTPSPALDAGQIIGPDAFPKTRPVGIVWGLPGPLAGVPRGTVGSAGRALKEPHVPWLSQISVLGSSTSRACACVCVLARALSCSTCSSLWLLSDHIRCLRTHLLSMHVLPA